MRVDDLADARAGDKGDTLILAVLPRDPAHWPHLREHLTAERVREHFGPAVSGPVTRCEVPGLPGLVFRIPGILRGGVTASTALDGHGKTLSYHLLSMELPVLEPLPEWLHYAHYMRHATLQAAREWLLTAFVAVALMAIAAWALPGRRLTLLVIIVSIGAATLGKLSYSLEKAVLRRIRSRRTPGGA